MVLMGGFYMRIMRFFRTLISATLISTVLFSSIIFTGCGKTSKGTVKIIQEDDTWYDSVSFDVDPGIELDASEEMDCAALTILDDTVYGIYTKIDYDDLSGGSILIGYDLEGNKIIDTPIVSDVDDQYDRITISSMFGTKDNAIVLAECVPEIGTFAIDICFGKLDLDTGKITDLHTVKELYYTEIWFDYLVSTEDYGIFVCQKVNSTDSNYLLKIFKGEEFICTTELEKYFADTPIREIKNVYLTEKDTLRFTTNSLGGKIIIFDVDLNTGEVKNDKTFDPYSEIVEEDASDTPEFDDTLRTSIEGDFYSISPYSNSIMKYNMDDDTFTDVISLNDFNFDYGCISPSQDTYVYSHTEDRTILLSNSVSSFFDRYSITVLKKADKNPNAGKQIIDYCVGEGFGIDEFTGDAIVAFNESSDKYYLRSMPDGGDLYLTLNSEDMPDIVFNCSNIRFFRDEFLIDISDYLSEDNKALIFDNIYEAAKYNGKIYSFPISFTTNGIMTKTKNVDEGKMGFTFDEYTAFVSDVCNGTDPFAASFNNTRMDFIRNCFNMTPCIETNKADFDREDFRNFCQYAKDNFAENVSMPSEEMEIYVKDEAPKPAAVFTNVFSYKEYIGGSRGIMTAVLLGTPSEGAEGPYATFDQSISAVKGTECEEGIRDFLNFTVKCDFATPGSYSNNINMDYCRKCAEYEGKEMNTYASNLMSHNGFTMDNLVDIGLGISNEQLIDNYIGSIKNTSSFRYTDMEIDMVITEELGGYFSGDRSIDETISYINDRVQKILSERS